MKHRVETTYMETIELSLSDIRKLTFDVLNTHGCDTKNASSISHIITDAERDGCESHGLFRLPGYVASLQSGKANGKAEPKLTTKSPVIIEVDGQKGFAPIAHEVGLPRLVSAAKTFGVAVLFPSTHPSFRSTLARDGVFSKKRPGWHGMYVILTKGRTTRD